MLFKPSENIDQVLNQMDAIILQCRQEESRLAYFSLLYRHVTANVKKGIADGFFEDGERMERLDVVFANRFLEAYHQYRHQQTPSKSWLVAFEAAKNSDLIILQHLFLGMNAHINLDLGVAAATIAPNNNLSALQNDFMKINDLLFAMVDQIQQQLENVSPLLGWLDRIAGIHDEKFAAFSLGKARDHAWNLANLLAPLPPAAWQGAIHTADEATAVLARMINAPKLRISRWTLRMINRWESKDVEKILQAMQAKGA